MESLVLEICEGATRRGERMSEALALYVARVIMENDPVRYPPNKEMELEDIQCLIETAITQICEKDAPSMETIKMQMALDLAYKKSEAFLVSVRKKETEEKNESIRTILATRPKNASDFDTLTVLYRRIFNYLCRVSKSAKDVLQIYQRYSSGEDEEGQEAMEKEIAAAMESVFPRIGLRSFVHLNNEEKRAQLEELARIVTGIRLFNRCTGKGGAALYAIENVVSKIANNTHEILRIEVKQQQDLLEKYQLALTLQSSNQRWTQELCNRRQYFAYLSSMFEDATANLRRITHQRERFFAEMDELKALVSGKTSVPKERVYPMFDAIATAWFQLNDELRTVETHLKTLDELHHFRESFSITLKIPEQHNNNTQQNMISDESPKNKDDNTNKTSVQSPKDSFDSLPPKLISIETTPEFMQLPLEYQGFCGWTIAKREGLVIPGKPELGVVKYKGACHVFASMQALKEFQQSPDEIRQAVLEAAAKAPELVHLLRLQDQYHGMSVPRALATFAEKKNQPTHTFFAKQTQDATTETPTHFVEKHIDYNYDWNEWNLRRRTLRIAQLQKCTTTSAQTVDSCFRRDNFSQVYLPRIASTQTSRDSSTNSVTRTQYLAGIRGGTANHGPLLKYTKNKKKQATPCIVDLTLEQLCT